MAHLAIKTSALSKVFHASPPLLGLARGGGLRGTPSPSPSKAVVKAVSIEVERGEIVGLMGPNGAGKSTLVKMLCTLISPTSGTAQVAGLPLTQQAAIRKSVGLIVPDERSFYWRLTGRQNLTFFAGLHQRFGLAARERVNQLLDLVDLQSVADERFDRYSSGMKQRMAIARGMIHQPTLLFLDEPTRALDADQKARLHQLIRDFNRNEGTTVFIITHDREEASQLCDRVLHMVDGEVVGGRW